MKKQLSFLDMEIPQKHSNRIGKQAKFEDYDGFVEKFKPKKTTDDCYTPSIIMDAVNNWVANEYHLDKVKFVRSFYPGGDYKNCEYSGSVVVDNPPFSILSEIIKFYAEKNIKFFLFCPTLTCCRYGDIATVLPVGVGITYENGAVINTSFVTNCEPHEIKAEREKAEREKAEREKAERWHLSKRELAIIAGLNNQKED